jgi:hypothetical protein
MRIFSEAEIMSRAWVWLFAIAATGVMLPACSDSNTNFEHRLVVNPAGVQHHYFEGKRQPTLDLSNPVPDVNRALLFLRLPMVHSVPTETRIRHMTWDSYGEGRMTADIGSCTRGRGTCIQKVMVTPSRRDMMRNQAEGRANQRFITADELGREWPFTVSFGIVSCHGAGEVYFTAEDRTRYTANGLAMSARPNDPHVRAIWKDAPTGTPGGGKVDISRVVQTGLALCR